MGARGGLPGGGRPGLQSSVSAPRGIQLDPICLNFCPQEQGFLPWAAGPWQPRACWKNLGMGNVLLASRLQPEAWRLVPGRVPIISFPRVGFLSIYNYFGLNSPDSSPLPAPPAQKLFLHASLGRFCPLCPWETQGGLGQISGWGWRATGIECRRGVPVAARAVGSGHTGTFPSGCGCSAALEKH